MLLPWLGFAIGWINSQIFRQSKPDTIAIVLENGAKNTGLTMFLITFALEQPAADIAMIIPIAVSITTPIPCIVYGVVKKIWQWYVCNVLQVSILTFQFLRQSKKTSKKLDENSTAIIEPVERVTVAERL